jgi:hypothetical protein
MVSSIVSDDDGYYVLVKPFELEKSVPFLEKGSFDWNGKKRDMFLIPCWCVTKLKKIDEYKTLHQEVVITSVGGWLGGDLTRSLTYKFAMEKLSSDIHSKYDFVFSKFLSKDKKIGDYREILEKSPDQGKLVSNIFFSTSEDEEIKGI